MSNILRVRNYNKLPAAVAATAIALGATACGSEKDYSITPKDTAITCVEIDDGATLRSGPYVPAIHDGAQNTIHKVELVDDERYNVDATINVTTPSGVHVEHDNNSTWYGLSAEDLTKAFKSKDDINSIKNDNDGIIWVNEQRANDCSKG